jgi:CheY-like chemotaxis protein
MRNDPVRILIVDDDQDVLIELERLLEDQGYSTATAWSSREALALADKFRFDLLLVDEHLGDIDRRALLDELARRQPHALPCSMHTTREVVNNKSAIQPATVCKWEHAAVKAMVRRCLVA